MITREEYNNALDIVVAYKKQLLEGCVNSSLRNAGKTKIEEWDKLHLCSRRLENILKAYHNFQNKENNFFIEDITKTTFKNVRNAGQYSWTEFEQLRGY